MNENLQAAIIAVIADSYDQELIHAGMRAGGRAADLAKILTSMQKVERNELEKACANIKPEGMRYAAIEREVALRHRRVVAKLDTTSSFSEGIDNAYFFLARELAK